jgi:hypothetical protein
MPDHRAEIVALAQGFIEELQAAVAAAHERLRTGTLRFGAALPEEHAGEPLSAPEDLVAARVRESDPIFATREFDLPAEVADSLVTFDENA